MREHLLQYLCFIVASCAIHDWKLHWQDVQRTLIPISSHYQSWQQSNTPLGLECWKNSGETADLAAPKSLRCGLHNGRVMLFDSLELRLISACEPRTLGLTRFAFDPSPDPDIIRYRRNRDFSNTPAHRCDIYHDWLNTRGNWLYR